MDSQGRYVASPRTEGREVGGLALMVLGPTLGMSKAFGPTQSGGRRRKEETIPPHGIENMNYHELLAV